MNFGGYLCVGIGPMKSGKSSFLNSRLTTLADIGKKCVYICHQADEQRDNDESIQSDNFMSSHSSNFKGLSHKVVKIRLTKLSDYDASSVDVIGIDEAQLYEDLFDTVKYWVDVLNKFVYVIGLNGDFERKKYGQTLKLIPEATDVKFFHAYCEQCLDEMKTLNFHGDMSNFYACFSARLTPEKEQTSIGSKNYKPMCRAHHSQHIKKQSLTEK